MVNSNIKKNITSEADVLFAGVYSNKSVRADGGKLRRLLNFVLRRHRRPDDDADPDSAKNFLNPLWKSDVIPLFYQ